MNYLLKRAKKLLASQIKELQGYEFIIKYNSNEEILDKEDTLIVVLELYEEDNN